MSDNAVDDILASIDLKALAGQVGASPAQVKKAVQAAVPTLLGSLQANATDADGAASLERALGQHTGEIGSLDEIDIEDGRKILGHAFAGQPERLGALAGQNGDLLAKIMPVLAPIVMNWLANNLLGGGKSKAAGGDMLGDLLGGLLGGDSGGSGGSGGLGDLLGGVLGGIFGGQEPTAPAKKKAPAKQQSTGGDALGELLGQILGGGR